MIPDTGTETGNVRVFCNDGGHGHDVRDLFLAGNGESVVEGTESFPPLRSVRH